MQIGKWLADELNGVKLGKYPIGQFGQLRLWAINDSGKQLASMKVADRERKGFGYSDVIQKYVDGRKARELPPDVPPSEFADEVDDSDFLSP